MGARVAGFSLVLLLVLGCSSSEGDAGARTTGGAGGNAGTSGGAGAPAGSGGSASGASGSSGSAGNPVAGGPDGEATAVSVDLPESTERDALERELDGLTGLDAAGLLARRPTPFVEALDYDPLSAARLGEIQASALSLDPAESAVLSERGFVISGRQEFPSFVNGYTAIYGADLPLYVSADSILNAVHRSYDSILEVTEAEALIPALRDLLSGMRARLQNGEAASLGELASVDADLYLTVALGLLEEDPVAPVGFAAATDVAELSALAVDAAGLRKDFVLFGIARDIDFSQYEPRGHYTNSAELARYFRAMTWLGLGDLRLVETVFEDGEVKRLFRRRQLELAYALGELMDDEARLAWKRIDDVIRAFVGEADNMTLPELDALLVDLGVGTPAELADLDDAAIAQAIIDRGYGAQQISGHILKNGTGEELPLSSTFLLFGKRYVVDSHVFHNVVYARVPRRDAPLRLMPNPLDVAYAGLGNDGAAKLLESELVRFAYAPELEASRVAVDAHPEAFWHANLYNEWVSALRSLSPGGAIADPPSAGMPLVTGTEAWNRRILNTQLASWAELRHDTLLYAKQSYTDAPACEFPDAYVEPYPEFFAALARYADHGARLAAELDVLESSYLGAQVLDYFAHLGSVAERLRSLAEKQRAGTAFSADDLEFMNGIVADGGGCFFDPRGWYAQLVFGYESERDTEFDPTIADVHTQPADESGAIVGRVLHAGTGPARLLVVTVDTCSGPRAYVGLASSYFERITEDFERMTDPLWAGELTDSTPPDVPWVADLVAR